MTNEAGEEVLVDDNSEERAFMLSGEHLNILDQRRADHLSGKSQHQSWEEVHARIRNRRKGDLIMSFKCVDV